MFEYNSKIDYLFLKKSIEPIGVYRDELFIRDVYNLIREPNDDFSNKLKSLVHSFTKNFINTFAKNSLYSVISYDLSFLYSYLLKNYKEVK